MKKQISKYILSSTLVLLGLIGLASCNDDFNSINDNSGLRFSEEGYLCIGADLEIPGMESVATRALDETPDYANLKLFLLVFETGKGLRQFEKINTNAYQQDDKHGHQNLVVMPDTLELQPTENNAVVHLVATNQPDFESTVTFGTEERVITALSTSNGYEAYWQRIDLGSNIPSAETADPSSTMFIPGDKEKAERIKTLFNHVPMIRNFCRVSVNTSRVTSTFKLTGIYVMNTVDCGTVAPYVAGNEPGSRFVTYYKGGNGGPYEGMTYAEITAQNHVGSLPVGVQLINTDPNPANITTKSESTTGTVKPVYFYERPARKNDERTFVILRGQFNGGSDTYYKVDLGNSQPSDLGKKIGLFDFYNLLRNFDYVINLRRVDDAGYDTFEEAVKGSVFNNFSAALETRNMASISDGDDILTVNRTSFVFTSDEQVMDLLAMYKEDITAGNGELKNELIKIEVGPGDVISKIEEESTPYIDESGSWRHWKVYGNMPDATQREQVVYVYRGNKSGDDDNPEYGLYRIITFILTKPWNLAHIDVFNDNTIETPVWGSTNNRNVGRGIGANVALFFELPGNLPEAIFPLRFTIESDLQNIQNAYVGNAVVNSVPASKSLFNDDADPPKTSRIQYVKTVTWEDYDALKNPEDKDAAGSPIMRVRFLTITDLNATVIVKDETRLRLKCENFGWYDNTGKLIDYFETTFRRP